MEGSQVQDAFFNSTGNLIIDQDPPEPRMILVLGFYWRNIQPQTLIEIEARIHTPYWSSS